MHFPSQPTVPLILFNAVLVVTLIALSWRARKKPFLIPAPLRLICWILVAVCMIFPFYDIDFFNYIELMDVLKYQGNDLDSVRGELLQFEWPYYYIGRFVGYNYILFRLIVWGGSTLLYILTMRRLKLNPSVFILYFTIIALLLISYGRVTLAWALAFYGYSFLIKPIESKGKLLSYILGIALIAFSVNFHKTAVLLPLVFLLSSIKLNRGLILALLIAFPVLVYLANSQLLLEILSMSQDDSALLNVGTAQLYMGSDEDRMGIAAILQEMLRVLVFYGFLFICIRRLWDKQTLRNESRQIKSFADVAIWLIYVSSIFAFTTSANTHLIYYRFLNFAVLPMTVVLSDMAVNAHQKKYIYILNYCAVVYTIYRLLYAIYLAN
jgi:hypothetical protein